MLLANESVSPYLYVPWCHILMLYYEGTSCNQKVCCRNSECQRQCALDMRCTGVARRLDASARALETALVAPVGAHSTGPVAVAASEHMAVTSPRFLPSLSLADSIREASFLCGDSNRCVGADPAWCRSAPCNSSHAQHTLLAEFEAAESHGEPGSMLQHCLLIVWCYVMDSCGRTQMCRAG